MWDLWKELPRWTKWCKDSADADQSRIQKYLAHCCEAGVERLYDHGCMGLKTDEGKIFLHTEAGMQEVVREAPYRYKAVGKTVPRRSLKGDQLQGADALDVRDWEDWRPRPRSPNERLDYLQSGMKRARNGEEVGNLLLSKSEEVKKWISEQETTDRDFERLLRHLGWEGNVDEIQDPSAVRCGLHNAIEVALGMHPVPYCI